MLTIQEYQDLWSTHFGGIVPIVSNPVGCPADYCDYFNREHMLEDYLDIFRGVSTRKDRPIQPCNGWYYPHPFFDVHENPLIGIPCIKYILVAEACPPHGKNYFYNIWEIKKQGYLCAAYKAAYNGIGPVVRWAPLKNPGDKTHALLDLAKRGVLLLDLFPFALNYCLPKGNSLRNKLTDRKNIYSKVTDSFWNDITNPYSLQKRINSINSPLSSISDLCMIAPPLLSLFILKYLPQIVAISGGVYPSVFKDRCIHPKRSMGSDFKKFAVNTSNNPDSDLITVAFFFNSNFFIKTD